MTATQTEISNRLLLAALEYAQEGLAVFPLHGVQGGRCTCGGRSRCKPGKHPRTLHGFEDATRDPRVITGWWKRWPEANIGMPTGTINGRVVLDIDPRHGGDESLAELELLQGALPDTVEAITGGGGRHIVFANPPLHLKCRTGVRPGIDFKAEGGYVVLAPSVHESGSEYVWEVSHHPEEVALAAMPKWLVELVRDSRSGASAGSDRENREETEKNEPYGSVSQCSSVISVLSVLSVTQVPTDIAQSIAEAIEESVPRAAGIRNDAVFDFARRLHSIGSMAGVEPASLRPIVKLWHKRAYPVIGSKPFEHTWGDFLWGFPRVQFPKGEEPLSQIIARADAAEPPTCCADYEVPEIIRLVKICRALQAAAGDAPFFLSCRVAGEVLGIDHNTAAKHLKFLRADQILKVEEANTKTRATRYRYIAVD